MHPGMKLLISSDRRQLITHGPLKCIVVYYTLWICQRHAITACKECGPHLVFIVLVNPHPVPSH